MEERSLARTQELYTPIEKGAACSRSATRLRWYPYLLSVSYRNSLRYLCRFWASLHGRAYIFKQYCLDIASCAYTSSLPSKPQTSMLLFHQAEKAFALLLARTKPHTTTRQPYEKHRPFHYLS